ncbi:K(+) efflux antiporter 4-like isoform A [Micractinium conductrix]|uniref:K(+) efflux antiporter 4-like isoform A n=1 Tax=Micractinium conductrix TaxID=554055 RepID=A0A2P6VES3_9CHLO|nr:K(+) efflux antiporter 4-like isoform A [Micractinium conductrix]|eukprot:PSC72593.1 K(+) efflux antiporter 4-like isoform A [Micractinium conductrix]
MMRLWRTGLGAVLVASLLVALVPASAASGRLGVAASGALASPPPPLAQRPAGLLFSALDAAAAGLTRSRKTEEHGEALAAKEGDPEAPAGKGDAHEAGEEGEKKETIAQFLDEALHEEFKKEAAQKEEVGKQFNETVASDEGTQETVVIISSSKKKANATAIAAAAEAAAEAEDEKEKERDKAFPKTAGTAGGGAGSSAHDDSSHPTYIAGGTGSLGGGVALAGGGGNTRSSGDGGGGGDAASEADAEKAAVAAEKAAVKEERKKELEEKLEAAAEADVDRIIDSKDNEYVLSKPSDESMGMNLDPQFVKDLTVLIAASAAGGLIMGSLGQPAINGYFIAGSVVGPGGLSLIKEIVQVQSVAQLGVQLLLFTLGLEFSITKLRAVRNVALLGGLLQTALFAVLAGLGAKLIGTSAAQGAFVGALVAMSSTSIVVKVLADYRAQHTQQGQITIGTLILQDCLVGLLFAFMPVLATAAGEGGFDLSLLLTVMARVAGKLAVLAVGALVVARTVLPPTWRVLARRFGTDSFQLASIAFCLLCALASARQGLSAELGAFVAGVMLSATEQQEAILHHLEPVTQFFLALFISSTGLVLSPTFLVHHLPLLAAGASVVILSKTVLIAAVVSAFHYPAATALAVGLNLSQIGEFVFVLLSMANQQALLADNVYLLLMGITALTLLVTPFLLQLSNRFVPKPRGGYPNGGGGDLELAGPQALPGGSPSAQPRDGATQQQRQRAAGRLAAGPLRGPLVAMPLLLPAAAEEPWRYNAKSSPPDRPRGGGGGGAAPAGEEGSGGGGLGGLTSVVRRAGSGGSTGVLAGLQDR